MFVNNNDGICTIAREKDFFFGWETREVEEKSEQLFLKEICFDGWKFYEVSQTIDESKEIELQEIIKKNKKTSEDFLRMKELQSTLLIKTKKLIKTLSL